jgi:hypothetical protein
MTPEELLSEVLYFYANFLLAGTDVMEFEVSKEHLINMLKQGQEAVETVNRIKKAYNL